MADTTPKRVALVTGGTRGIGRVVALALARAGHDVGVASLPTEPLDEIQAELEKLRVRAVAVEVDVTDPISVEGAVSQVTNALGPPLILVNNAGIASAAPLTKLSLGDWEKTFAVNCTGVFLATRTCLPGMLEEGFGRVINIGSTAALQGFAYTAHYTASKHAVLGLTRALALEVATKGITVNCVCPGFADTEMTQRSLDNIVTKTGRPREDALRQLTRHSPQKRLIQPDEVAAAVVYLASDDAYGVNGQAIVING